MPAMSQSVRLALLRKAVEQRRAYQASLFELHAALADDSGDAYLALVADPRSATAPTAQYEVLKASVGNVYNEFEDFEDVDKFALERLAHIHAQAAPQ